MRIWLAEEYKTWYDWYINNFFFSVTFPQIDLSFANSYLKSSLFLPSLEMLMSCPARLPSVFTIFSRTKSHILSQRYALIWLRRVIPSLFTFFPARCSSAINGRKILVVGRCILLANTALVQAGLLSFVVDLFLSYFSLLCYFWPRFLVIVYVYFHTRFQFIRYSVTIWYICLGEGTCI